MSGIGFSDHCYTPHDTSYCMPASRLDDYIAECRALHDEYTAGLTFSAASSRIISEVAPTADTIML